MKYRTALCLIIKDELDLDEWIIYHKLIGFDHIYIYDNNEIPVDLDHKNCTHIHFPGSVEQINAYNHWIKSFKSECEYVCFIDADEYVVFNSNYNSVGEVLNALPNDHDALILNRKLFVNIEEQRKEGLVFETNKIWQKFWFRENYKEKPFLINFENAIKTFSKTELIKKIDNPHTIDYYLDSINFYSGTLNSKCEVKNFSYWIKEEPQIWINHYYIKSLSEFRHKCLVRGRATTHEKRNLTKELNGSTSRFNPNSVLSSEPTEILLWNKKVKRYLDEFEKQRYN